MEFTINDILDIHGLDPLPDFPVPFDKVIHAAEKFVFLFFSFREVIRNLLIASLSVLRMDSFLDEYNWICNCRSDFLLVFLTRTFRTYFRRGQLKKGIPRTSMN
jgi:hypothetical protein